MMRMVSVLPALLPILLATTSGCGSETSADSAAASVGVRVDPPTAIVAPSATVAFRATVTGTATANVVWTADCGSVTQAGVYTAPQTYGTCRVSATVAAVSASSLVSVDAGGWAAKCAAEPEPTTNVVYACDCQPGADVVCQYSSSPAGTKANPWRTWSQVQTAFRSLPAGGTLALCKGGRFLADVDGLQSWVNTNCSAAAPCTVRDYAPSWGSTAAPVIARTAASGNVFTFWGNSTTVTGNTRILNLRIIRPDGGMTAASRNSQGIRAYDNVPNLEVCNCDIDGFEIGLYGADSDTTACRNSGWKIRGNRFLNSCTFAILGNYSDLDIDGNYFDNNAHSGCGTWNPAIQSGGTPHTMYISGRSCPMNNVRIANNEIHRHGMFQGDFTTVQTYVDGTGWVRTGGAWYDKPYTQGSVIVFKDAQNVAFENNLFDLTPVHPAMPIVAISGGNPDPTYVPLSGIVVRRNRILAGRGRAIGISSMASGMIEDNTVIVSTPDTKWSLGVIEIPHELDATSPTLAAVRNNTVYVSGVAPSNLSGIRVATKTATTGTVVTGNSVTFAAGGGLACFRVDDPSKVAMMNNNQCTGAPNYATNGATQVRYSLDSWRAATGFDVDSIMPPFTGLFVNAPTDLTPAVGSPLIGTASKALTCTILGVPNQPCSSPIAIGSPAWSPLDTGVARSSPPSIGAFNE